MRLDLKILTKLKRKFIGMEKNKDRWNISNKLITKTKLGILKKCFNMWLIVWTVSTLR